MWGQHAGAAPAASWNQSQSWQSQPQWQRQQQPQQQRYEPPKQVQPALAAAPAPRMDNYIAFTEGTDGGESVIQTLVGEFLHQGENHGRPYFRKAPLRPGQEPPEVFLYYWDSRDGASFAGWWFGKSVGGNEVWSHNIASTEAPPNRGWKIPFAGSVRPGFCVMAKTAQNVMGREAPNREKEKKVQELGEAIANAVSQANSAAEKAKITIGDGSNVEALREAEKLMSPFANLLGDMERKLQAIGSSSESAKTYGQKLRFAISTLAAELSKTRLAIPKAMKVQTDSEVQTRDRASLQEVVKEMTEKAKAAEDSVDKTALTAELVAQAGDDLTEAQKAVEDTEAAAKAAQILLKEALAMVGAKLALVRRFDSHVVREEAPLLLNPIRDRVKQANQRLIPLLTVKQDFKMRQAAKQVAHEVFVKLAGAEVGIEKAERAVTPLRAGASNPDHLKDAESAVAEATEQLELTERLLEIRIRNATGLVKQELMKAEDKIRLTTRRLEEVRGVYREVQERQTCSNLLPEVGEKMLAVHQSVHALESLLAPTLIQDEAASLEEALAAIKAGEEAMKSANKATSAAKICIAMKKVEIKRFNADIGQDVQRRLQDYQSELDIAMKKVSDLKSAATEKKQSALRSEVEAQVKRAEELLKRAVELTDQLGDEAGLAEMPVEELREQGAAIQDAQTAAQQAGRRALELITQRQIEAKAAGTALEDTALLKGFQDRMRRAQTEVAKFKRLPPVVQQQLALKRIIDIAASTVSTAEEKVAAAEDKVEEFKRLEAEGSANGEVTSDAEATQGAVTAAQAAFNRATQHLEIQRRSDKIPKEELEKLLDRMKEIQQKMEAVQAVMQEGAEKAAARTLLIEVEQRIKEAEVTLESAGEAAFRSQDSEDGEVADPSHFKEALASGNKALGSAKTFLAVKKIAAKRLSENVAQSCLEDLGKLQERLDAVGKKLGELQREISDRKYLKIKQEAQAKIEDVRTKAAAFKEAVDALESDEHKDIEPLAMKGIFEKAGACQQEAQRAIETLRPMLAGPLRDVKPGESEVVAELRDLLMKLKPIQEELDVQRKRLGDREQRFVAGRLLKDAVQMFEKLEEKLEETTAAAAPFVSDAPQEGRKDFAGALMLKWVTEALRREAAASGQSLEALFVDMGGREEGGLREEQFVSFLQGLKELAPVPEVEPPSREKLQLAFAWLSSKGSEEVLLKDFLEQLRPRYYCSSVVTLTEGAKIEGSTAVRKLDLHETLVALEEPDKDESKGLVRLKVRAEKDGAEGYCTLSGNQGTVFLEPSSRYSEGTRAVDLCLRECLESINQTMAFLKQKSEEIGALQGMGALGEVKAELMKMRVRASKAQTTHGTLKRKVQEAQRKLEQDLQDEQQRLRDAKDQASAAVFMKEAGELVERLEQALEAAATPAQELIERLGKSHKDLDPFSEMNSAETAVRSVLSDLTQGQAEVLRITEEVAAQPPSKQFTEAKRSIQQMEKRLPPIDFRCKYLLKALQETRANILQEARSALAAALRAHSEKVSAAPDELFSQLGKGQDEVSVAVLRSVLLAESAEGDEGSQAQLELGLERCGSLSRLGFLSLFQEYKKCVKEIALTTEFAVKSSTTLRRLEVGEKVLVLGKKQLEQRTGLLRVQCRTLQDAIEGWVTIKGNQGTAFLEDAEKPFYICESADNGVVLYEACDSTGPQIRPIQAGEVFELLEGPTRESPLEVSRARGRIGGQVGWVTMKDAGPNSPSNFERASRYVCRGSVAITSAFEIDQCETIRKLEIGEVVEALEDAQQDPARKISRLRIRASKDGQEGFATMKGNQGTVYIAESTSFYTTQRSVPLERDFTSGQNTLRQLEQGELLEVLEGPCTESRRGLLLARGRTLSGGDVGWFAVGSELRVRPWSAPHLCTEPTELRETETVEGPTVRTLESGEQLEALEPPRLLEGGILCLRLRALRDGAVGFAPAFGPSGSRLLEPAVATQGGV